jgi:hypothetical protein
MPTKKKNKKLNFKKLPSPKLKNHFALVLDSSGSMGYVASDVVTAFNQHIDDITANAKKENQETTLTFLTFGETGSNYGGESDVKLNYAFGSVSGPIPIQKLGNRPGEIRYRPGGNTPLFDAVGRTIEELNLAVDRHDPNTSFVVFVITDGEDNASTRYTGHGIKLLLADKQATDRWTFAFLMPPGKGAAFARTYGIPTGNIREWEATTQGVQEYAAATSNSIGAFYSSRSMGSTASQSFFQTDASKITKTMLKKELTDLSKLVYEWTVDKEVSIKELVEAKRKQFVIGAGFYQLMKKEVIQGNKQILIKDKSTGKVYGGPEARELLKLPDFEVKVEPGNHANYEIFVQSTSHNRKLPRGTKLLYRTDITVDLKHTWVDPTKGVTP